MKIPKIIALAMLFAWSPAQATVYQLNPLSLSGNNGDPINPIFSSYQVNGTITTDGTTGLLHQENILSWDLLITSNITPPANLTPSNSQSSWWHPSLTATPSSLYFDFSAQGSLAFFSNASCGLGSGGSCLSFGANRFAGGYVSAYTDTNDPNAPGGFASYSTNVPIATAVPAVPELSTWAMMISGFTGLGILTYRQRKTASLRTA